MISKKLLEAVLGEEYKPRLVETIEIENNMLCTYYEGKYRYLGLEINIYELAHKCKEWALEQNYSFTVRYSKSITLVYITYLLTGKSFDFIKEDTEPKAVFTACEWILEQGEKDDK